MNPSPRTTRRQLLQRAASAAALGVAAPALLGGCAGRDPAPDFTYTGLDGKPGNTQALRGKVVLVNFWATSCVTCVAEMPQLMATHDKYKARGYDTLAVAMSYDPPAYVSRFAESRKLPFGVVIDNTGAIAKAYGDVSIT
ncbi:MAG: TlpA family protein disulfide reductase, partial [Rubrivivax sp.]|nr:TlpA family protein disulfide reductase [Rubrivivax sp.]